MATKTISIELDVYEWLVSSREHPSESFSQVLRRMKNGRRTWTGATLRNFILEGAGGFTITPEEEAMILGVDPLEDQDDNAA